MKKPGQKNHNKSLLNDAVNVCTTQLYKGIFVLWMALITIGAQAQNPPINYNIRLNQIGFYPNLEKIAIVAGNPAAGNFYVKSLDLATTYFTGTLGASATWSFSNETVRAADFSAFTTPGTYVLDVTGVGYSPPFIIDADAMNILSKTVLKGFYYKRASTAITAQYGGVYARAEGHPDTQVKIHASAASPGRPTGTIVSSPKGWYDAGDYGCYVVNSGISTYTLMSSYEHFQSYYDTLPLNIPESGNGTPDILNEVKWNLDWMLTMQDPYDGGVYHKKTTAAFDQFEMPEDDQAQRYLIGKATAATFDFAAVMAVAYRVYLPYNPTFANQCLAAAKSAYTWGVANPNIAFNNPSDISTGGYGDGSLGDEKEWAATELYISTKDNSYYSNSFKNANSYTVPSWPTVNTLGLISLVHHRKNLTALGYADTTAIKNKLFAIANPIRTHKTTASAYKTGMGTNGNADFIWGSNSQALNEGMICMAAYLATNDLTYMNTAISQLDYILGRNATTYSFVSGVGSKRIMNPHDRISSSDGVTDPIPGWMAGGPNTDSRGDCGAGLYPSANKAMSYLDSQCSYSTNEIAINWNAPLVFIGVAAQYVNRTALNPEIQVLNVSTVVPSNNSPAISTGTAVINTASGTLTLTIKNTGAVPLTITSIVGDAIFSVGTLSPASPIAAGASSTFTVTGTPTSIGANTGKVTIKTNDQSNSIFTINLTVTGTPPPAPIIKVTQGATVYTSNGAAFTFPSTAQGSTSAETLFTITNTGNAALSISDLTIAGPFELAQALTSTSIAAGGSATFSVVFKPVSVSTVTGTATISSNVTGSPFILNFSGTGTTPPAPKIKITQGATVYVSNSTTFAFPATVQGGTSDAVVFMITNTGNAALTVSGITLTGPFELSQSFTTISIAAGSSVNFSVVFKPVSTGAATGVATIASNATGSPFKLKLSGTGTAVPAPGIQVTQGAAVYTSNGSAFVFPATVQGGTSSSVDFIITNTGNAALSVSSLTITGPFQLAQTFTTTSIAAGSSATFSVVFKPVSTGAVTGTATIASNVTGSPFVLNFSGTGTLATATVGVLASDAILISPNPTKQDVAIQINGSFNNVSINVYNTLGELVISTVLGDAVDTSVPLALTNMASGMYIVEIITDQGNSMKRVVKE